jgi:hypothetical protein
VGGVSFITGYLPFSCLSGQGYEASLDMRLPDLSAKIKLVNGKLPLYIL